MQRSDFLIRLISLILFIALAVYIGYAFYDSQANPFATAMAINYTVEDAVETHGHAVRYETLLPGAQNVALAAEEGEHLSASDPYAIEYRSAEAMARAQEIRALELRISQVDALLSGESTATGKAAVWRLVRAIHDKDAGVLDAALLDAQTYIFHKGAGSSAEELEQLRGELVSQKSRLEAAADADTQPLIAGRAGVFSAITDGFESVSPASLAAMTPSQLTETFAAPGDAAGIGRLITGPRWYYAAILSTDDAKRLTVGSSAQLHFSQTYGRTLTMRVESIGPAEDGACVVTFSGNKFLSEIAALREMSAQVVFNAFSGLRVPKRAVRLDEEGKTYLFILSGLQAQQVYINILGELGDYYVVESVKTGQLVEGTNVIIRANGLYDGKVVQ